MQYTAQRDRLRAADLPRARRHHRRLPGRAPSWRSASSCSTTRSRAAAVDPLTGRIRQKIPRFTVYPSQPLRDAARPGAGAIETIKKSCASGSTSWSKAGQAGRGAAAGAAHPLRPGDAARRWATARASRTTRGTFGRQARRAAADAGRLPAERRADVPRREPRADRPARRHVQRRPRAQGETLVEYGFRLPSALDNRPLKFEEFERKMRQAVFVSATPADYEQQHAGQVVEQVVRPTGLVDPEVEVRPPRTRSTTCCRRSANACGQRARADHHADQAHGRAADRLPGRQRRPVRYLHSDIDTRRARRDPPRPAAGHLRRAGGHQPAARGAGHSRR